MNDHEHTGAAQSETAHEISRDELAKLPLLRYEGPIHTVRTLAEVAVAMVDIRHEHVVGFDTETRPAFRKGESYLPSIAQVATAKAVYVFALRSAEVHSTLAEMLGAPAIIKVGVALAYDLRTLKQRFEFTEQRVLDLGLVARRHGCKQTGVRNLAGLFLGCRIPKGASTSNWAAPSLTPAQLTYAATDAWVCRELYLKFAANDWVRI